MIVWFQTCLITNPKSYMIPLGRILNDVELKKEMCDGRKAWMIYHHGKKIMYGTIDEPLMGFKTINLETGEIIPPKTSGIPERFLNPLTRAIELARYKKKRGIK